MQTSPEIEKRICAMFDSFCKTVIRNFSRNLKRAAANQSKHFSTGNLSVQYLLDSLTCEDNLPSEQYILYLDRCPCIIENELLYHALESLKENQRTVLLMNMPAFTPDFTIRDTRQFTHILNATKNVKRLLIGISMVSAMKYRQD